MSSSAAQEIKARLNIVDLVGDYVRLNKAGANWKGLCPFHHEKSPSFMVNEEKQIYHCFGCGKGGDALAFVMEIESLDFVSTLKLLAERTGVPLEEFRHEKTGQKNKTLEILELATKFFEHQLWQGTGREKILPYLKKRGIAEDSARLFRLGYAPNGWSNILDYLVGKGYLPEEINKTGLLVEKDNHQSSKYYDRFRDRIMFPVADSLGKVVGYSARVAPGGDETQAKYINTPQTEAYDKSAALYGIFQAKHAIKEQDAAILVEGNLDVIAAHQAGFGNTVAISGTALTEKQLATLRRFSLNVILLFDMDNAGANALEKSTMLCWQQELNPFVAVLRGVKDAAEALEKDPVILQQAIAEKQDAMEYYFSQALVGKSELSAKDKSSIAQKLGTKVAVMANAIEQEHWIKKIAKALEVGEDKILQVAQKNQAASRETKTYAPRSNQKASRTKEVKTRMRLIKDKLIGTLLASPEAWQALTAKYSGDEYVLADKFLARLIERGPICHWEADELLLLIGDEQAREFLRKLAFEAKFQFRAGNVLELDTAELIKLSGEYLAGFRQELQKEKLSVIIRDIKSAEQTGDQAALEILMKEFNRLSQALK